MKGIAASFAILIILFIEQNEKFVASDSAIVPEESKVSIRPIYEIDNLCTNGVCNGFEFAELDKVAFFDLKAVVLINNQSTYDFINPLPYKRLVFENSVFAHFPLHLFYSIDLEELDMRNCSMEIITWEGFLAAENLKILLLSDNKIKKIDEWTFNYANYLQFIFLENNRIDTLDSNSFRGLDKLRNLYLSNNRIETLPEGVFDYLTSLRELDISNNRLHSIENELFIHNPNLIAVYLKDNELEKIGEYTFKNQANMNLLDISNNKQLKKLVMNIRTKYLIAVNCSLNRINIYGVAVDVDMRGNNILELYFAEPEMLETLNLRNNALEQIASLTRATKLRILNIADNPDIKSLPDEWAAESLENLDLSNISLTSIPISIVATQPKLRRLNVSRNKIRELNPMNFKYFEKLDYFYIHENDWNCYNLKMIMDSLIKPHHISYNPDTVNEQFPGEYINSIACMYRVENENENENEETKNIFDNDSIKMSKQVRSNDETITETTLSDRETTTTITTTDEIQNLRNEIKIIVNFYDQKFDKMFKKIENLSARLRQFENFKSSLFDHVTITT